MAFYWKFSTNPNVAATDGKKLRWSVSSISKPEEFITQVSLEQNRVENAYANPTQLETLFCKMLVL